MSLEGRTAEEIAALAELAQSLADNPKTRAGFLQLTKTANPATHIPEIDIPAGINNVLAQGLKRVEAIEAAQRERDAKDRVLEARKKALERGVSESDIPAIEKLMIEKSIPDHGTAADFFKMQQRAAEPTAASAAGPRTMGAPVLPDLKDFGGSLKNFSRASAYGVIDELRGRKAHA